MSESGSARGRRGTRRQPAALSPARWASGPPGPGRRRARAKFRWERRGEAGRPRERGPGRSGGWRGRGGWGGPGPLRGEWPGARAFVPGSARASEDTSGEPAAPPRGPCGADQPVGEGTLLPRALSRRRAARRCSRRAGLPFHMAGARRGLASGPGRRGTEGLAGGVTAGQRPRPAREGARAAGRRSAGRTPDLAAGPAGARPFLSHARSHTHTRARGHVADTLPRATPAAAPPRTRAVTRRAPLAPLARRSLPPPRPPGPGAERYPAMVAAERRPSPAVRFPLCSPPWFPTEPLLTRAAPPPPPNSRAKRGFLARSQQWGDDTMTDCLNPSDHDPPPLRTGVLRGSPAPLQVRGRPGGLGDLWACGLSG